MNNLNERNVILSGLGKFIRYKISVVVFIWKGEGVVSFGRGGIILEDSEC